MDQLIYVVKNFDTQSHTICSEHWPEGAYIYIQQCYHYQDGYEYYVLTCNYHDDWDVDVNVKTREDLETKILQLMSKKCPCGELSWATCKQGRSMQQFQVQKD